MVGERGQGTELIGHVAGLVKLFEAQIAQAGVIEPRQIIQADVLERPPPMAAASAR